MENVRRFDRGELVPAHKTAEGYVYFEGYATRAGVFPYKRADGSIQWELRPPEEVGSPDSLQSLARKPVTDLHPESFVDAENVDKYGVGSVDPEVVWEKDYADGFVKVRGTVQRADAVASIAGGRRELSCGYTADLDMEPGEWTDAKGTTWKYDAIQRNIQYNHLALVDRGRAGRHARLRLDSLDAEMINQTQTAKKPKRNDMKIKINGKEYDIEEAGAIQRAVTDLEQAKADADVAIVAAKQDAKQAQEKADAADEKVAEFEAVKAELDVLKASTKQKNDGDDDQAAKLAWAKERFELVEMARDLKLDGFEAFGDVAGENAEIKRTIVMSRFDEADITSEAHVDAAFSLMKKAPEKKKNNLANTVAPNGNVPEEKNDGDDLMKAQAEYNAHIAGQSIN